MFSNNISFYLYFDISNFYTLFYDGVADIRSVLIRDTHPNDEMRLRKKKSNRSDFDYS